jgi:predicted AAA+ superfamily ATPase
LLFKNLERSGIFAKIMRAVSLDAVSANETGGLIFGAAAEMIAEAEKYSMAGDLWEFFFALAIAGDENPVCAVYERKSVPAGAFGILAQELWNSHKCVSAVKGMVASGERYRPLDSLKDFAPRLGGGTLRARPAYEDVAELAARFAASSSPDDMAAALADFCSRRGAGKFALDGAFTWNSASKELVPVDDTDPAALDSLIGYEAQKAELRANIGAFLSGRPSNNILLFGDSGTGKSSSVRALLNEPGFVLRGLRIIELRHDQFGEIPDILREIRGRDYRFILFMDDLSFEEFEVGYKHLKALIEGSVERKPDNTIIVATSNRRNIIREVWGDRAARPDDVHGWDTMQEKHSLADRFGVTIWYPSATRGEYLTMVAAMAEEKGLAIERGEMEKLAMRWELERGGFTGRVAYQFVCDMLKREDKL